jgi:hypothetical protein
MILGFAQTVSPVLLRLLLPFCYGFVTGQTSIPLPFYRDVTGVTALAGGRGVMPYTSNCEQSLEALIDTNIDIVEISVVHSVG